MALSSRNRVHSVHVTNVARVLGGQQPLLQADWLEPQIHILHIGQLCQPMMDPIRFYTATMHKHSRYSA